MGRRSRLPRGHAGVNPGGRADPLGDSHRYLALYHLESPAVTQSAAWKAAVDTPWSKRVRPHFRDRIRIEARRYVRGG
jgi:hypothetical protein